MLRLLNQYSRNRTAWFLLFVFSLFFELIALYFQHQLNIAPCVLCIYQRTVIFGIIIASLIALLSPKRFLLRFIALIIWIYCAVKGFLIAYEQAIIQFEPSLFHSCPLHVAFPKWLPLNTWFPAVFESYGMCSQKVWHFMTIEMSQWMMLIFACYIVVGMLVLISQPFRLPNRTVWKN